MANKFKNIRARCVQGHTHDSKFEAAYCSTLWGLEGEGKILSYQCQIPFVLAGGITHVVDFLVCVDKPNCWEVHETKGFETDVWKIKKKLFEEKYPNIKYKVIYQNKRRTRKCPRKTIKDKLLRRIKVYR